MPIVGYLDNLAQALAIANPIAITIQLSNAGGFARRQTGAKGLVALWINGRMAPWP
ncbi:hypothetical protein IQ218_06095 [Synechocystis salina LEGE 06099]|uniref:hypothetical protein n=1 Tax=Synechocystis salina TaxID=945780 RepID=UPI0018829751|nr:hypothetical protein [Synechocystis salina]MBE9203105.1 hypothetical protein [Synechocystis salina LEGE 06099]